MNINIVSHTTLPSESVGRLQEALGVPDMLTFHYGKGVSKWEQYKFFEDQELPALEYTDDIGVAEKWLEQGHTVMARTKIKGQAGSGIVVLKPGCEELLDAKIYTKYISHKREFRVNLFQHKLVNVREKLRKIGTKGDFHIRNLANGYTTAKCTSYPEEIVALAEKASAVSNSDFIGVDIGYNEAKAYAFVIEVNSGPSIEGSSVQDFVEAIKNAVS